jgi:AbrB family looped-hinge helix DNA binding protein
MVISKIGRRGQLTLPSEVRRQANLKEGDRVAFVVEGEHIVLQPLTQTLLDLRGSVAVAGPQNFAAIRRQVLAGRANQVSRQGT